MHLQLFPGVVSALLLLNATKTLVQLCAVSLGLLIFKVAFKKTDRYSCFLVVEWNLFLEANSMSFQ